MRWIAPLFLVIALLAGCQAKPKATQTAGGPNVIASLTDQKVVYSCPQCGMDFDGPGKCNMCDVDLVKTDVSYVCPADGQPVDKAGTCPRCNMRAKVVKTAVAADTPAPGATPGTEGAGSATPGATGTGTANGS
jgi:hypothetical protein